MTKEEIAAKNGGVFINREKRAVEVVPRGGYLEGDDWEEWYSSAEQWEEDGKLLPW